MKKVNIHIRATQEFKEMALKKAKDQGFTSLTAYLTHLTFNDKKEK